MGNCDICSRNDKLKHLPIYVKGSEGIEICFDCEMNVVSYLRIMIQWVAIGRKEGFKMGRRKEAGDG